MNTLQLIALWYGGLVTIIVLFDYRGLSVWPSLAMVGIGTGLLICTFDSRTKANQRTVLYSVVWLFLAIYAITRGINSDEFRSWTEEVRQGFQRGYEGGRSQGR